jgi:hypothetical protein
MHVSKDSMWRGIWKFLQNFLGTKPALINPRVYGMDSIIMFIIEA